MITLDLETTMRSPITNNKAHPMWRDNRIVLAGFKLNEEGVRTWRNETLAHDAYQDRLIQLIRNEGENFVVGHNLKFDLSYIYRFTTIPLPSLWDTQLAEYLLTGQQVKYASLDELIVAYLGTGCKKDGAIKEFFDNGTPTELIPAGQLRDYCINDVACTYAIFKEQWAIAQERNIIPWMMSQMDALRATISMHRRGMTVDWMKLSKLKTYFDGQVEVKSLLLEDRGVNWRSPKELSLYFFGGTKKEVVREKIGYYKNGNEKFKNKDVEVAVTGKYDAAKHGFTKGLNGYYSCNDDVLNKLLTVEKDILCADILELRKYSKYSETYLQGLLDVKFPNDFIYPNINHVNTNTGRLSSSEPNMQNQTTDGGLKEVFTSRWGPEGVLVEADFGQLEIVWLAYLSGDHQLIDDLNSGRDMHTELFKDMYGFVPTKEQRKEFKPRSFQLVYGASYHAIAEQAKISDSEAQRFINVFYKRYPGIENFHSDMQTLAKNEKTIYYIKDEPGPRYMYTHKMPWGRQYVFKSYEREVVSWKFGEKITKKEQRISPTELKNYLVQGSATGDFVPMMLGIIERYLEANYFDKAILINTVHDSVLLDCHKDVWYNAAKDVKALMEDGAKACENVLGIDFPCFFTAGIAAGSDWGNLSDITFEEI